MNKHLSIALVSLVLWSGWSRPATAQITNSQWVPAGTADYNMGANWTNPMSGMVVPDAGFDEIATINNGGTAFVANMPGFPPGGVLLGQGASDSGTLEIRSGGNLSVEIQPANTDPDPPGTIVVGQAGTGHLRVLRGGTLTSAGALSSGGASASSIVLGETGGTGTATITINAASNLNRTTRIVGPNVNYTTNSLVLGGQHNLVAQITGANHSSIHVNGSATLGGALSIEFSGVTPMPGNTWDLVDATSIGGSFAQVTSNATLDPGFGLFVDTVQENNRRIAQLSVGSRLQLSVDRRTGATTISNLTDSASFDIDGYLVTSAGGALDPAGWTSFSDAGMADWREGNPSDMHIAETNLTGSRVIGPGASVAVGNLYGFAPTQIGETLEDLAFEYHVAGDRTFGGLIEYTGLNNNLVLFVDPATGESAVQNQSTFNVDVDGYLITSLASSLDPAAWDSLTDQGAPGWTESNPAANHIGETNLTGSSPLASGALVSLGNLFDFDKPMVARDLTFEYHIAGGNTIQGIVEYGLPPDIMPPGGIPGDYNNNGAVEQADLDLVLLNWGQPGVPNGWVNDLPEGNIDQAELDGVLLNWGDMAAAGLGNAAGVPEPSAWILAIAACAAFAAARRFGSPTHRNN
jgi:hypothetical protein